MNPYNSDQLQQNLCKSLCGKIFNNLIELFITQNNISYHIKNHQHMRKNLKMLCMFYLSSYRKTKMYLFQVNYTLNHHFLARNTYLCYPNRICFNEDLCQQYTKQLLSNSCQSLNTNMFHFQLGYFYKNCPLVDLSQQEVFDLLLVFFKI